MRAAKPTIAELSKASKHMPELGNNLAIVAGHLHDRNFAVEKDPRSPGGKGYTGFEALLSYVYDQSMAINTFDSNGYMLKVNLFLSECSDYQSLASLKEKLKTDPAFYQRCAAILGPNQPGITQPDPSYTGAQKGSELHLPAAARKEKKAPETKPQDPERKPTEEAKQRAEELAERIEETLGIELPELPAGPAIPALPIPLPSLPGGAQAPVAQTQELLDFLLAP